MSEKYEYSEGYGDRIRKIRAVLEISQKMFAKNIGVLPSVLSEVEREVTKPNYSILMKMAETFDVNPSWVLLNHGDMFLSSQRSNDLNPCDFGDQTEKIRDLLSFCKKSPFVRLSVVSYFTKFLLDNETVIQRDILRHNPQKT